ncbi:MULTISPECIES: ead/Ea22-like family protein [Klebsiella]|uniref:ead/Ea22-like family protein n=1 Tax=Klebsiella pneumoniae complex TaxID=3390273 RepID=UPI000E2DBBB0|nr:MULTISPECIES: ead/Ea22-like family protein [Klebsiella]MBX4572734.1 hypothetical protein [Klebsiella pneumoniae]SXC99016.1 Uncharacterised protein [Klebsiella quasipneumoniae]
MTDITELAQQELAQLRAELSNQAIGSKDHLRKIALSLVDKLEKCRDREIRWLALSDEKSKIITDQEEALEKAKGMEACWKVQCRGITDHCEELQACIAELESRTVTVKLPQRLQPGADGWDDWYVHSDDEGEYLKFDDVLAMLTAAGIKVEAE